jgi:hypothetical protein
MYPFDQNNQQQYQQYAQASDSGDYSQVDPNEATSHVQQFAQNAPPEMQQQVYGQAFQQMPQDQREQFVQQLPPEAQGQMDPNDPQGMGQSLHQMGQQDPNLLQKVWNNPMGKIAAVGIAGFAAKEILSHR